MHGSLAYRTDARPLGAPLVEYRPPPLAPSLARAARHPSVVLGVVVFLALVVTFARSPLEVIALTTMLAAALATVGARRAARRRGARVQLHELGLLVGEGATARALWWDDVVALRLDRGAEPDARQTIELRTDEDALRLGDGLVLGDLLDRVEEATFAPIEKRVRVALERGEAVPFGPFTVTADALAHGSSRLEWSRVRLDERGGRFVVHADLADGVEWASASVAEVDSARVFLSVVRRLT